MFIFFLLLGFTSMCKSVYVTQQVIANRKSEFDNLIVLSNSFSRNRSVNSLMDCLISCRSVPFCQSIFYTDTDKFCQTNTVGYFEDSNWVQAIGTLFYTTSSEMCPFNKGYAFNNGHNLCYKFHSKGSLNWTSARQVCLKEGGDLIILDNQGKYQHIVNVILSSKGLSEPMNGYFVGALDQADGNGWKWLNNKSLPVVSLLWGKGLPNGDSTQMRYARIRNQIGYKLDDSPPTDTFDFICEILVL